MTTQIAVRLDDALVAGLDAEAIASSTTRSELIRRAVERFLYAAACQREVDWLDANPRENVAIDAFPPTWREDGEDWSSFPAAS